MAGIWSLLMVLSAAMALSSGRGGEAAQALLASGTQAVTLMMTLLATMTLWSGLMEILSAAGDVARLGRLFRRILSPLFPGLTVESAWNAISLNLSANLLGLGNAATPAGVEAAQRLAALGKTGLRALSMLLVLDNASLQLIPTTVIAMRQAAGAHDPADIWAMTLVVSGASMIAAVLMMQIISPGGAKYERNERRSHHGPCRPDRAAGNAVGL